MRNARGFSLISIAPEQGEEVTAWYVRGANPEPEEGLLVLAAYHAMAAPAVFLGAYEQLHEMEEHLRSDAAFAADHAQLERYVRDHGREVERRMLQAHLDLRAARECPVDVRGADGVRRTTRRQRSRTLLTVVGRVKVKRWAYEAKGVDALHPADAALNLPDDLYSFGVRRLVAEEACKISFDEVVEQTKKITGAAVPKRQVEQLTMRAARDFVAFYATRAVQVEDTTALLVFGFNGKGVVVRHEDLREGTKKAAEKSKHKLQTRLTQGEKRNRKRTAQVATVYTVEPWVRTPMDILHELRSVRPVATPRPRPVNKRVWASLEAEPKKVIAEAFAEGQRRDPARKRRWVVVVDGNRDQLRRVKWAAKKAGGEVTILLDLIHVLEYFWKAAHCFHEAGSPALEQWVNQRLLVLLQGRAAGAFAKDLRRWAARSELDKDKQKVVRDCIRYLVNNHRLLHYDRALAAGLPLASGAIEGACRHLVQDRLDITGARWSLRGAEAVLKLRALRSSGDFEQYWAFHLAQERVRNHEVRYANKQVPGPLWPTKPTWIR
jgi:hypothetical protein